MTETAAARLETMPAWVLREAQLMAEAINGGDWDTHYTEAQKVGWCLKVRWAVNRYADHRASEVAQ